VQVQSQPEVDEYARRVGLFVIFNSSVGTVLESAHSRIHLGIPVSTTHTITGAIVGVGAVRNKRAVRWTVTGRIVWTWLLTIPAAGLIAAAVYAVIALVQRVF
jgi:phosphate/sulfate permease